jgi:hypothetical protein
MVVFQEGPMKKWLLLPLFLCLLVAPAGATSVDIGVNDFSVQLQLANPLYADDYGTVQFRGRLLYNNKEETRLASAGLMFVGEPGNVPGLDLGIGAQLYGGRTDEGQDLLALGLGGLLTYAPPVLGGVGVSGKLFYAPQILSGLDTDRVLETGVRVSYAVTPKVRLYAEYQNLRSDFEKRGNWTIDEGVRVGFAASF